ncbi:uncharacterized protein LOC130718477 isoform X1 [Lotus japonicus]|uniref:uncharacterized protein LOC130718477 isoform X1 n=1 Tax=Lotus japonicus TaxID=34305 RepID=UPI002586BBA1|nr:uncharacterized protein LOC130718477 isoform X1 [Lotus japonicus]XP_057425059.1 uncharacterized protein LOC130718477 isoform X1 [Lotus japonicus]
MEDITESYDEGGSFDSVLLKKQGWKEGNGLGISEQGRLEPMETCVKNNKRGLGADKGKKKAVKSDDSNVSEGNYQQITKGLLEKYGPERVLDTPITEIETSLYLRQYARTNSEKYQLFINLYAKVLEGHSPLSSRGVLNNDTLKTPLTLI